MDKSLHEKFCLRKFLFFFCFIFSVNTYSQIVVNPNISSAELINSLVGQGITATNVVINCPKGAYGSFNGTSSNLGMDKGVALTTGKLQNAIGPNTYTLGGSCTDSIPGNIDPQLLQIEPKAKFDGCAVEFDIVPQCSNLQVKFVFGSEEYPEFVNSNFNDVFGFFISGPGPSPACTAGFYDNTNVATLPDNSTIVSIDNVNANKNNSFFRDNSGGGSLEYDGLTTVLTRNVDLCPCQTYHFKIAIADAGDCNYDSGVFIEFIQCQSVFTISPSTTPADCSCNGTATAIASGGVGPYTYNWFNTPGSGNVPTITGLCPGINAYSVLVDDALSCTPSLVSTQSVEGKAPVLSIKKTNVCKGKCNGTAAAKVRSGVEPYTYLWSNGATTDSIAGLCAGTYSVKVIDAVGCTDTMSIIIKETIINLSVIPVFADCKQTNGSAIPIIQGGAAPYTYIWKDSIGAPLVQNGIAAVDLPKGDYTVTVIDSFGCENTVPFNIWQSGCNTISCDRTINYFKDTLRCDEKCTGTAHAGPPIGGTLFGPSPGSLRKVSYIWSNGATTPTLSNLCGGDYAVIVKAQFWPDTTNNDSSYCYTIATTNIIQTPAIKSTVSTVPATCNVGGSATILATGGTGSYDYVWLNPAGKGQTMDSLAPAMSWSYAVVDKNDPSCSFFAGVAVVPGGPAKSSFEVTHSSPCNGSTCSDSAQAFLYGGAGTSFNYSWNTYPTTTVEQTTKQAKNLCVGKYTLTVKDDVGCIYHDTIEIPSSSVFIKTAVTPSSCGQANGAARVTAAFGGKAPYKYQWSNGGTSDRILGLLPNVYTVTVSDSLGCARDTSLVVNNNGTVGVTASIISSTDVSCNGACDGTAKSQAVGGTPPYLYSWNSTPVQSSLQATNLCAGNYIVTITDRNGCIGAAPVTINQSSSPLKSVVTPVNVSCPEGKDGSASIIASGGTAPYNFLWSDQQITADATGLAAGFYSVSVRDNKGCVDSAKVTISQPAPLTLIPSSSNSVCQSSSGKASVNVSGGTPLYSYSWNTTPIQKTQTAVGLRSGIYEVVVTDQNGCENTTSVPVSDGGEPHIQIVKTNNINCYGDSSGSIDLKVISGPQPYIFKWSNGASSEDLTNIKAGKYSVTVTDKNGCVAAADAIITQADSIGIVAKIKSVDCNGGNTGSISLKVNGGAAPYSYLWSSDQSSKDLSTLTKGIYTVTVTDQRFCSVQKTYTISEPFPLSLAMSKTDAGCSNNKGIAKVNVSGGTIPYSYTWDTNPEQFNDQINNFSAGIYHVTVSDANNCIGSDSIEITSPPAIIISIDTVGTSCKNFDGIATANVSGGKFPFTYSWNTVPAQTTSQASGLKAGNYTVTVTDGNGCVQTAIASITTKGDPQIKIASITNIKCNGSATGILDLEIISGKGPFVYSWSNGKNTEDLSNLNAGNYSVTVTDINGCIGAVNGTVREPLPIILKTSKVDASCGLSNGIGFVKVTGGTFPYTYNWSTNPVQINDTVMNLSQGNYSVSVTDANSCNAISQIKILQNAVPTVTANPDSICQGQSSLLVAKGTSGATFIWSTGETGPSIKVSPLQTGKNIYTVYATKNGCSSAPSPVTVFVFGSPQFTFLTKEKDACFLDGPQVLEAPLKGIEYSYQWQPSNKSQDSIQVSQAGTYSLTIKNQFGCSFTAQIKLNNFCEPKLFVPNAITPNGDGINDSLAIFYRYIKDFELMIFNRWGEMVYKEQSNTKGINTEGKGQNTWDGNYLNAPAPFETYPYILKYNSSIPNDRQNPRTKRGSVTVVR